MGLCEQGTPCSGIIIETFDIRSQLNAHYIAMLHQCYSAQRGSEDPKTCRVCQTLICYSCEIAFAISTETKYVYCLSQINAAPE